MRSSLTSGSRFPCRTRLAVLVAAVAALSLAGCDDEATCGSAGTSAIGIVAGDDQITLTYGGLVSGINNDCPDPDAPEGVISMTIAGTQTDGTGLITLCVSRPDELATTKLALGIDVVPSDVHIVDVGGTANGCTFTFDDTRPPTGTASTEGLCDNGANPAGFVLILDGAISLDRTCGATVDKVAVTLRGRIAVTAAPE